jgi:hypothetical protein
LRRREAARVAPFQHAHVEGRAAVFHHFDVKILARIGADTDAVSRIGWRILRTLNDMAAGDDMHVVGDETTTNGTAILVMNNDPALITAHERSPALPIAACCLGRISPLRGWRQTL